MTTDTTQPDEALAQQIMNLPMRPPADIPRHVVSAAWHGYQIGHRDARHAAAELVLAAPAQPATLPFDIEAMLAACLPGGDVCDPQQVADSIRQYASAQPATAQPAARDWQDLDDGACAQVLRETLQREVTLAEVTRYQKALAATVRRLIAERVAAAVAAERARAVPDEYGSTDFGYTFAGIELQEGDKRLMAMLVMALGTDHPAVADMTALLFRARAPAAPPATTPEPATDALTTDQRYWLDRRAEIIDALAARGLEIVSNRDGVWLRDRGQAADAQAEAREALNLDARNACRAVFVQYGEEEARRTANAVRDAWIVGHKLVLAERAAMQAERGEPTK